MRTSVFASAILEMENQTVSVDVSKFVRSQLVAEDSTLLTVDKTTGTVTGHGNGTTRVILL